jgi:hypothetical protein
MMPDLNWAGLAERESHSRKSVRGTRKPLDHDISTPAHRPDGVMRPKRIWDIEPFIRRYPFPSDIPGRRNAISG